MKLDIPELSLVVLVGPSGAGKSTFARRHFKPTEVVSSDTCRGLVADDENDQAATPDAFDVLQFIAGKRLAAGRLAVVDATSVQKDARKPLIELARRHHALPVAIVLALDPALCVERNAARPEREDSRRFVRSQAMQLRQSLGRLQDEGFRRVHVLRTPEEVDAVELVRTRMWCDRRDDHGPFDIIGDIHGCYAELVELLTALDYHVAADGFTVTPPPARRALFLGDLVDRGPDTPGVLRLVMAMVRAGTALCVPGNHEARLLRKLRGKNVNLHHGLAETMAQLGLLPEAERESFQREVAAFIDKLVSHLVLDDGKLVVAHAGMKSELQGRGSGTVRQFALYGETTGETDSFGFPERVDWARDYRGKPLVVYGHTPVPTAQWVNNTICIDTGCVFGGALTALRYPERELVDVRAHATHCEPVKPLLPETQTAARDHADLLDISDVQGKRIIGTRVHHTVTVREEQAAAALEVMSRFAVDPRWLIYLPPTMSPCETAPAGDDLLEHPREAFAYFQRQGVTRVVCQEKHMGSRAVVVLCRDSAAAERRFHIQSDAAGVITTRTGRPFFRNAAIEAALLARLRAAATHAGLWQHFATDWLCLDAELLPWSEKARELLQGQYAAVGSSSRRALHEAAALVSAAQRRLDGSTELAELSTALEARRELAERYVSAYRRYCWPVERIEDLKLAPFHLLASEGKVHSDQSHLWHLDVLGKLAAADPAVLIATPHLEVDLSDATSIERGTTWWTELTERGGEGMVIKPLAWLNRNGRGLVQPALKVRGKEYLRIIYGPEYTLPQHLTRLRSRGLAAKRSLALREYALGLEALQRFVENEPLYRVHECVFGVLALESEAVDPRL
jgi:protein phosphatase